MTNNKPLTLAVDLYGCPNRCLHCWLSHMPNRVMEPDADEWIAVFLGEHPETLEGVWQLSVQMKAAVGQLGGIGSASFEEGVNYFKTFYGDSVKLGFGGFGEDGLIREKTYYAWETEGVSPYNFQSANYTYEEKRNTGRVFHDLSYYGKLSFTITDENYDEAITMKR